MSKLQIRQFEVYINKQSGVFLNGLTTECWLWEGYIDNLGYGTYQTDWAKKLGTIKAHRLSYHLFKEAFLPTTEKTKNILHQCDNPKCVNPDHLRLGTQLENIKERDDRGRQVTLKGINNGFAKFKEQDQIDKIIELRLLGKNFTQIGEIMGTTRKTISKICTAKTYQEFNIEKLIDIKSTFLKQLVDNKIKELVKQGKSYRQIQIEVNRSPSYICGLF